MADRHSKPCPLYSFDQPVIGSFKRQEDLFKEFGFHPSPVIFKHKLIVPNAILRRMLVDAYQDPSPIRSVLNCIGKDIHQYLLNPLRVADYIFMLYPHHMDIQFMPLAFDFRLHHDNQVLQQFPDV